MRLGTETNSLVNHLYANSAGEYPAVGMGATLLNWTDRKPATIRAVRELTGKLWVCEIEVTEDDARRIDDNGMSESQEYEYSLREDGYRMLFRQCRNTGKWFAGRISPRTGRFNKDGGGILIGTREKYHDFSF